MGSAVTGATYFVLGPGEAIRGAMALAASAGDIVGVEPMYE